jgi:hypothetical protein
MTDVEVYRPATEVAVPDSRDTDSWITVCSDVIKVANVIHDTPFVPDGLRGSAPAVAAAILAGRELGIGPMTALQHIHVIKGKPAQSAALMRALIQGAGHQWQDGDVTDTRAVVRGRRKGESEWAEVTFTADQAKRAGIDLGKYPQDKLYARATSRLARRKFADVIAGMPYSAEELEDGDEAPSNGHQPESEKPAQRTARRRQAAKDASPAATQRPPTASPPTPPADAAGEVPQPPLPGEDEPAPDDRHRKLVGIVQTHFKRLGFSDDEREQRLVATAKLAALNEISTTNDLDESELSTVADALARCKNRDALIALIVAADTPEAP